MITVKKYLKHNNITIIHSHSSSYFFAFSLKLIYPKINIIWHDHYGKSEELEKRKVYPLKIISFFFSNIISVNNKLKEWSLKKLKTKKVYFLNNFASFNNVKKETILACLMLQIRSNNVEFITCRN